MGGTTQPQRPGPVGADQSISARAGTQPAGIGSRAESGFDSALDSALDSPLDSHPPFTGGTLLPAQRALLSAVHHGVANPADHSPLAASFGPQGAMHFDFVHAQVLADPMAWRALRVARALPQAVARAEPGMSATWREMDLTLWDLGIAAGALDDAPLRDAPPDWWHAPLVPLMPQSLPRYTAVPAHLELARLLMTDGPATPAQLARRCRVTVLELRSFIQAGLFLGLLHWMPATTVAP